MPAANDLRKGQVITFNGEPHLIMETQHRTPGNLRAFVQVKMRNLRYGKSLEQRFNSPDHVDVLSTDRRTLEFSYADRDTYLHLHGHQYLDDDADVHANRYANSYPDADVYANGDAN